MRKSLRVERAAQARLDGKGKGGGPGGGQRRGGRRLRDARRVAAPSRQSKAMLGTQDAGTRTLEAFQLIGRQMSIHSALVNPELGCAIHAADDGDDARSPGAETAGPPAPAGLN